ncbi:hypothetical protein FRC01_014190, partial [Tulasnella sp. 417]
MRAIFRIRLVAVLWKETLDGSPWVWAIASSTFPTQQNASNIRRSAELPLTIHYSGRPFLWENQDEILANIQFLQLTKPTLHRWKVAWFDSLEQNDLFQCLDQPAILLQELHIHSLTFISPDTEHYLFGGQLPNTKHLDLDGMVLPAHAVPVYGLRFLHLGHGFGQSIPVERLLEVVGGSPGLEHLGLTKLDLQMPSTLVTKSTIILNRLQSFRLRDLRGEEADYLIRHIQGPHCIQFDLCVAISRYGFDASSILDTALHAFEPVLRQIHRTTDESSLDIEGGGIAWSVGKSALAGTTRRQFIRLA